MKGRWRLTTIQRKKSPFPFQWQWSRTTQYKQWSLKKKVSIWTFQFHRKLLLLLLTYWNKDIIPIVFQNQHWLKVYNSVDLKRNSHCNLIISFRQSTRHNLFLLRAVFVSDRMLLSSGKAAKQFLLYIFTDKPWGMIFKIWIPRNMKQSRSLLQVQTPDTSPGTQGFRENYVKISW